MSSSEHDAVRVGLIMYSDGSPESNRAESPKRIEQLDEDYDRNSVVENPADLTISRDVFVRQLRKL